MTKSVVDKWSELQRIRNWITDQLSAETDSEVRDSLFKARQAIGASLLHLEKVHYLTGGSSNDYVE
jgi:hypothetical protein